LERQGSNISLKVKAGGGISHTREEDEVAELTGLSLQHLKEAVRDKNGWRELIHVVTKG